MIDLSKPKIMGIINASPDSFHEESRVSSIESALKTAEKMLKDGATFLDIGGMSSRPNAELISQKEEWDRVQPILSAIRKEFPKTIISIDTIYAKTAKQAVEHGAGIVNDISAGNLDSNMIQTVAELDVPYIAMHMKGTPATMKSMANYNDLLLEITDYFIARKIECEQAGIKDLILDPGFGFAKSIEHNFELLGRMGELAYLGCPLLAGISRKSMIWKSLEVDAGEALNGTTALHMVCLQQGAKILRVHDVKEAVECVKLFERL